MTTHLHEEWRRRASEFEHAAHSILSRHEDAQSRVVVLTETTAIVDSLSVPQGDLFKQAIRCAENELFRAAHVMAWAAFMDYLLEKLSADGLVALKAERPKWQGADIHEMAEFVPERQFVEVARPLGLCTKNEMNALISLLQRRNECAHPSGYLPGLNETLGYLSELLQRLKRLSAKDLKT